MKLGEHTIGLRDLQPRLDGGGSPVRDDFGDPIVDQVDVEVPWCSVTPTARRLDTTEPEDRVEPALTGMTLLAPPATPVTKESVVVWPITGRDTADGQLQLSGRTWQVVGEPGLWDESVEARLRAST